MTGMVVPAASVISEEIRITFGMAASVHAASRPGMNILPSKKKYWRETVAVGALMNHVQVPIVVRLVTTIIRREKARDELQSSVSFAADKK